MAQEQNMQENKTVHHLMQAERYVGMLDAVVADENNGLTTKEVTEVLGTLIGASLQLAGVRQNIADLIKQNVQAMQQVMQQQQAAQAKTQKDVIVPSFQPPADIGRER